MKLKGICQQIFTFIAMGKHMQFMKIKEHLDTNLF